ncbi:MAG: hypothetical protein KJ063_04525 [Anaerolineae bacterium]|nr:hypothetical protein [Anaerolineae bacterium]
MSIVLDSYNIPGKGRVQLRVKRDFTIQITAEEARRKVNAWLLNEVSYLFAALSPTLVVGDQIVWRVPAIYSLPHVGQVGTVGFVDVDVQNGELVSLPTLVNDLQEKALELAQHLPPYPGPFTVPETFVPKDVPPAPVLLLPEDE